ncbi:MAG: hypothetical protein LBC67_06590, partial [Spirochaetales bacterium]|nr:hypothetical protein [Spirochaetales bacterium]
AAAGLAVIFSCAAGPEARLFLPLEDGWYVYNFERLLKGVEDEYAFAASTGLTMVQEITLRQNGTVTCARGGFIFDPVLALRLRVDDEGAITSVDNPSVSGRLDSAGNFFWSGSLSINERVNKVFITGSLVRLPPESRAGAAFDGVYSLRDSGTGRRQLARVADGFYTWKYIDAEGTDEGFQPWPTLVEPDGSFRFDMEITTVLEMGSLGKANYSTAFFSEGKITPGEGVSLKEYSQTSGAGEAGEAGTPHFYSGGMARQGEYPNEEIPSDLGVKLAAELASPIPSQRFDWGAYPEWYLSPPKREGFLYGLGEKTFADKRAALAVAEAAAAADIAAQIRLNVTRMTEASWDGQRKSANTIILSGSLEKPEYRVHSSFYNEKTRTAFVLVEAPLR